MCACVLCLKEKEVVLTCLYLPRGLFSNCMLWKISIHFIYSESLRILHAVIP